MEKSGTTEPGPAQGPPIVIERKSRAGCLRRMVWPLLLFSVFLNIALFPQDHSLTPAKLDERYVAGKPLATQKVAVVEVRGVIMDGEVDHVLRQIRQAREDHQVKAIVLRVDSPGGTVSGSDRIWREVATLKAETDSRPVVVSMGGMAASGGYYVSAPADYIFAEPTTWTGSIGVIMQLPQLDKLMEKLGVGVATITKPTDGWKGSGSPFRPFTDRERARWDEVLDDAYQRFVRVVAQGRKLPMAEALAAADGKVYTAREALKLKLIDEIGYQDDAIKHAMRLANIDGVRVIRYAEPFSFASLLNAEARQDSPGIKVDADSILRLQTPHMLYLAR